jgi:hypothetical protein
MHILNLWKFQVEQLIQDESLIAAYELLDYFFEFILKQLSYIRKHKYVLFLIYLHKLKCDCHTNLFL